MTSVETDAAPPRRSLRAAAVIGGTGIALAAAYFPLLFNQFQLYDDEGVFDISVRLLLNGHGSLYAGIWADKYGPFYYLFATSLYRVIGQQPSLENGRWIVLSLTTASSFVFAAAA